MAPAKPMLDGVELPQTQRIASEDEEVLAQHGVPALEGDFLQDLGRRAVRVSLTGVLTGTEAGEDLKGLREKFRAAQPVPFVSDIATATRVDQVLIEEIGVRELAGKPERFEYALALREYTPPPAVEEEDPPDIPVPPVPMTATLVVEVIVEGDPDFDFSRVTVTTAGTAARTLTQRTGNVWTEEDFPPGQATVQAVVDEPGPMTGSAPAEVREGETTQVTITLRRDVLIAKAFIIHFWFDKAFVEPCLREVLQRVVSYSDAHPEERMLILGHTDLVGSDDYNQSLSERRGRSVYAFLTFGKDRAASVAEWNELRRRNLGGLITLHDSWSTREVQYMLQDLGYYTGNIDEQHGPATDAAVRAFQSDHGLTPDGILGDTTWEALVEAYLEQDSFSVPEDRFFRNARGDCDGGVLAWLGCGEQDPVLNTQDAWRPNRRTEILFIRADALPCEVAKPVTFDLPAPGAVGTSWCLGPGDPNRRACFLTRGEPQEGKWLVRPAEPGKVLVQGVITFEDGTPVANARYALIAPDGEYLHTDAQGNADLGERPQGPQRGRPIANRADALGRFRYPRETPEGVYILELLELQRPQVARTSEDPPASAIGNVVCARLEAGAAPAGERSSFVGAAGEAGTEPLHGIIQSGPGGEGPLHDDPDPGGAARWFLRSSGDPKADPREVPLARFSAKAGNDVKFYLNAPDLYADMRLEIEATSGESDLIYILGWDLDLDTPMGGKLLHDLLVEADRRRVPVRAMLNKNWMPGPGVVGSGPGPAPNNGPEVNFINNTLGNLGLNHGGAILDNRHLDFGTHHQKVLVVLNRQRLVAFCGGMDINPGRTNWHDVHCRIIGPAARDLHDTFAERWNDFPDKQSFVTHPTLVALRSGITGKGDLHVQIVHTYGDGSKHSGLGLPDFPPPGVYAFAPNGDQTVYHLIANAIRQTQKFIYLEDQYLIEESPMSGPAPLRPQQPMSNLLRDKVNDPDFERLVILVARTESVQGELFQAWARRQRFIQTIRGANPAKVTVCQYKIADPSQDVGTENPRYVHAKTWIFDDKFALIGSANCNRRGYTHDSEVAAGIFDENPKGDRLYFAHRLRMALWSKHLKMPQDKLVDPIVSSAHWSSPPQSAEIEIYNEDPAKSPAKNPQPDRRIPTGFIIGQILTSLDDDWNIVIDPDGS
jgi:phosphatidylserine/phosphatidylglycerophosphate/cardiolipin synthase-like enzyme/outer membrane protein OmpA-like peptidoglycan-associated protein